MKKLIIVLFTTLLTGCASTPIVDEDIRHAYRYVKTEVPGDLLPPPTKSLYSSIVDGSKYSDKLHPYLHDLRGYVIYIERYIDDLVIYMGVINTKKKSTCTGKIVLPTLPQLPLRPAVNNALSRDALWSVQLKYSAALKTHAQVITKVFQSTIDEYNAKCFS